MKILLTGCSGFIGKVVLNEAIKKYGVNNICVLSSRPLDKVLTIVHKGYNFLPDYFIKNGLIDINTIIHIGAFTPKNYNEENDIIKCNSNILNTEKLIFSEFPNLKKIIYTSTIDVYNSDNVITEKTIESPISLYGQSKLYCEKMISLFSKQKNVTYQILRLGHVFGPGEGNYKKIIPLSITSLIKNNTIELYGDGQSIRTFIYIDDVVKAILKAIELTQSEGVINIVGDTPISMECLANILLKIHKNKNAKIIYNPVHSHNYNLIFNNEKLKSKLLKNFTPIFSGLKNEYKYMKSNILE